MDFENWEEKRVLITGGTSGLGRALALRLGAAGARVAVVARRDAGLKDIVQECRRIIPIQADISQKEAIHPLAGEVEAKLGGVDALFNVAGYLGATPLRLLADTDCEDFERLLQTNLLGPFRLTKALLSSLALNGGLVVNISSDAAVNAYPTWGGYSVSKAALDHLTRIFSEEMKDLGVRFLSVDPGEMNTPMYFAANPGADPAKLRDPDDSAKRILATIGSSDLASVRVAV